MPRVEAAHLRAAASHDRAAASHDRAAGLFDLVGNTSSANRARERPRQDREGAVLERERVSLGSPTLAHIP